MVEMVGEARVIITHGGPSSFIMPLQIGKTPIVVPRHKKYGEHVNDHQVKFCHQVEERMGNIVVVDDITKLGGVIDSYDVIKKKERTLEIMQSFVNNWKALLMRCLRRRSKK